ncbi:putative proline dehydrogenase [Gordonia namibiensis NBRC 108229]|uniref:proline dehydrogenase n=1 Tax=Gordonia namibiensis NBRC 108229 TaxID=1208314 RepID=K6W0S6_9ACTN|nr:proline dehydrogenase family protein [Gordonia namibiensis]GAC02144.1 putative proline dehydrogenase [Gordonia namibiensis NBRC 108229]
MSTVFDTLLRPTITAAARSERIKQISQRWSVTEKVVRRFVPGETLDDVLAAIRRELDDGLAVTIDYLGEDTTDESQADATVAAYVSLLEMMRGLGTAPPGALEVSLKLTALGQRLPEHGAKIAEENARTIAAAAHRAGALVTIDAEDHTTVDERLAIVRSLRRDFPDVGTVLQAYLRRTEDDCAEFAASGARIRLCKGAYAEPPAVAYPDRRQIDEAYLRCLRILMKGNGYPMVASHDPTMIEAATILAAEFDRTPDTWEYQMLYGIRTDEQRRLVGSGARVRVYIPYGTEWYGYFVRRLAEKPGNLGFFLRALVG